MTDKYRINFDQMNDDLSVMEDVSLTPQEKKDLLLGEKTGMRGLYCTQCETCISQCPENVDIPTFMRSYMYAYGYKNLAAAQESLECMAPSEIPCELCDACTVHCTAGFDVKDRILDIARIQNVPEEFLV